MNEYEFFITITGLITAFLGVTLKMCFKSRCEDVNFGFGLLNIHRNVEVEQDIEAQRNIYGSESEKL